MMQRLPSQSLNNKTVAFDDARYLVMELIDDGSYSDVYKV